MFITFLKGSRCIRRLTGNLYQARADDLAFQREACPCLFDDPFFTIAPRKPFHDLVVKRVERLS